MSLSPLASLLSRKRLLIFDLDGTLVDSSPLHARAFQATFAPHGVQVDYASIAGMTTGTAVDQLVAGAGLGLAADERARLVADKRERALRLIESELDAIEGAIDFVRTAKDRFALALCTSASKAGADASLARVGLAGLFDPVVTAEDVTHGKPDPEPFVRALDAHDAEPGEALVFEDAQSGLAAAAAAGIEAVRIDPADEAAGWPPLLAALRELAP
jgi:HAD superfamily hydrolase (TIGR01509 family)